MELLLHRVHGVYKQVVIGAQINMPQIQGVEITLMLFQRHDTETALN